MGSKHQTLVSAMVDSRALKREKMIIEIFLLAELGLLHDKYQMLSF